MQPRRMPALAIEAIGVARDGSMLGTHGHNLQCGFRDLRIAFRLGAWPFAAGEDDGGFHQRGRRQEPDCVGGHLLIEPLPLRLVEENRYQRGGINHH
jgi:hypothetical protein